MVPKKGTKLEVESVEGEEREKCHFDFGFGFVFRRQSKGTWLPDDYGRIFRLYVFGPLGFWTMAPLRCAAKFDPFLSLDCAPPALHPGAIQGKEGIKFCHLATLGGGAQYKCLFTVGEPRQIVFHPPTNRIPPKDFQDSVSLSCSCRLHLRRRPSRRAISVKRDRRLY